MCSCDLDYWDSEDPIPRDELLKRVAGLDGLYCLLTEKIDSELLDTAGGLTNARNENKNCSVGIFNPELIRLVRNTL